MQTPSHLMPLPDGRVRSVNYDHTILGWRASLRLAQRLGKRAGLLPITQAIWYVPQGLNVWDQVLCQFPGHYARDQEHCDDRAAGADAADAQPFDGPAWSGPQIYFPDQEPLAGSAAPQQIPDMLDAIRQGERAEAYRLFLAMAQEPSLHAALADAILLAGISDLQDTIIDRANYQNIGHKALRARAMVDLANEMGWENAHDVFYTVVPDLGTTPILHALWTQVTGIVEAQFPDTWQSLKHTNVTALSPAEVEETVDVVLWGQQGDVIAHITGRLLEGKALLALGDAVLIAYCRYVTDLADHPSAFFRPGHAFDYCNVVHHWLRTYDNPQQAKAVYLEAAFVNDMARAHMRTPRDPVMALDPAAFAGWADSLPLRDVLPALGTAISDQDAERTLALVDSYLTRSPDRTDLLATIAFSASKFQNDPHIQRHCITAFEEYEHNQSGQRDQIIRAAAKYASRCVKRSLDFAAYDLYRERFADA